MRLLIHLLSIVMLFPMMVSAADQPASLEARRKALNDLLHEQWEYTLRRNPILASILGDKRYNDQIDDFSQKAIDEDLEQSRRFLARFEAIDTTAFPEQEALNKQLMVRDLKMNLAGARFKPWEMPVNQFSGIHIDAPQLVSILAFTNIKDYEDYIARLKKVPVLFEQNMDHMRQGLADGLMPPRILLEKVVEQANTIATTPVEQSPFARPFDKFPDAVPEGDRKRLREQGLAAIRESLMPAYGKFTSFVRDEYAPKGRTEPGVWSLPDGPERYAFRVREVTTTDLTPEQIHQIGLEQVKEIEGRMLGVAKELGYADLKTFRAAIRDDPKLHARSRQEILDLYRKYIDQMNARLPELFGRLPKAKLEIMPIEEFREKEAATHYVQGAADGSRPAHVMVNTGDFEKRSLADCETTAYHEGVPGHHMQIAIAQELPELPPERIFHCLHGGLGPLLGAPGQRSRLLPGPLQLLRTPRSRHATRHPPGCGYRLPLQALDAPAGGRFLSRPLRHRRTNRAERNRSLHGVARTGARIQDRTA